METELRRPDHRLSHDVEILPWSSKEQKTRTVVWPKARINFWQTKLRPSIRKTPKDVSYVPHQMPNTPGKSKTTRSHTRPTTATKTNILVEFAQETATNTNTPGKSKTTTSRTLTTATKTNILVEFAQERSFRPLMVNDSGWFLANLCLRLRPKDIFRFRTQTKRLSATEKIVCKYRSRAIYYLLYILK